MTARIKTRSELFSPPVCRRSSPLMMHAAHRNSTVVSRFRGIRGRPRVK